MLQPISGDMSARFVARNQPVKLAALEGQFRTQRGAPLRIGGLPDPAKETTRYAIEIPRGLSLLAFNDPDAEVVGLSAFPKDERPNPVPVHLAFQVMVACGIASGRRGGGGRRSWGGSGGSGSSLPAVSLRRCRLRPPGPPRRGGGLGRDRARAAAVGHT